MAEHSSADNVHTRKIAEFVAGVRYEQIPADVRERLKLLILDSLGCAIYGANLEWCRILQDTFGKLDATRTTSVWGTGLTLSSTNAALVNGTRGAELRARRRASRRRAACRRRHVAGAVRGGGEPCRSHRPRAAGRGARRLRDRAAGRQVHGPGAYRPGLAFRRDGRRVLGRRRRSARPRTGCGAHGARARHRGHAGRRPDGRAIRRDGQAHACRPLVAERALRRAAGEGRLHRHRRRVRGALWRLLHDVLALAGPLQARGAERGLRRTLRDHGRSR